MYCILKIVKSLEDSELLVEEVSQTTKNEEKEQKGGFHSMLLGTLGIMLAGKGVVRTGYGSKVEGITRAGYGSKGSSF